MIIEYTSMERYLRIYEDLYIKKVILKKYATRELVWKCGFKEQ